MTMTLNYGAATASSQNCHDQKINSRCPKVPCCHMFEEKREAVMAIEAAVLPLITHVEAVSARTG
jgi:hypothetical protein